MNNKYIFKKKVAPASKSADLAKKNLRIMEPRNYFRYKNGNHFYESLKQKKFNGPDRILLRQRQVCENFVVALYKARHN